jgi:hypothetical protein
MVVLLLDDERDFKDGRSTLVARSTQEALELTKDLNELDELWLDYVLAGTDSTDDFLFALRKRETPLNIKQVYIHTSSFSAVSLLEMLLGSLNVDPKNIIRVNHTDYFVTH